MKELIIKFQKHPIKQNGSQSLFFNKVPIDVQPPNFNPLIANPTKWSNTLKQFAAKLLKNCLSMFDHYVKLVFKGFLKTSQVVMLYTLGYQPPAYLKIEFNNLQKIIVNSREQFWNIYNLINQFALQLIWFALLPKSIIWFLQDEKLTISKDRLICKVNNIYTVLST